MNNQIRGSLPGNNYNRARGSIIAGSPPKRRKTCLLPKKFEYDQGRGAFRRLLSESNDDFAKILELDIEGNCQVSVLNPEFYEKKNSLWEKPNIEQEPESTVGISKEYIDIRHKTHYELVDEMMDKFPLLEIRKSLLRVKYGISELSKLVIENQYFEYFIILVIILNILILSLENPTDSNGVLEVIDRLFLIIYTIEAGMKVMAMGFLFSTGAYLRDNWNKMDFVIVVTGWLTTLSYNSVNLTSLRTLRILKPLRSISSISGMRILFVALIKSSIPLFASLLVLFFYLLIFAIAGVQLWAGLFRYQCMDVESGVYNGHVCGNYNCEFGRECVYSLDNPNFGVTNFDNIFSALLSVFECVTLEGWTDILIFSQKSFNDYVIFYYFPLVFIGSYLLLSIILAVIKNSFSKAIQEAQDQLKMKPEPVRKMRLSKIKADIHELSPENSIDRSLEEFPDMLKSNTGWPSLVLKNKGIDTRIVTEMQYRVDFDIEPENIEESISLNSPWEQENHEIIANTKEQGETQRDYTVKKSLDQGSQHSQIGRTGTLRSLRYTRTRYSGLVPFMKRYPTGLSDAYNLTGEISDLKFVITSEFQVSISSTVDIVPEDENQFICDKTEKFVFSDFDNDPIESMQAQKREFFLNEYRQYGSEIAIFSQFSLKFSKKKAFSQFFMHPKSIIEAIQLRDLMTQNTVGIWSGFDISKYKDHTNLISSINQMRFQRKYYFILKQSQTLLLEMTESKNFHIIMILCVILNTIVLSIDYHGISSELSYALSTTNTCFTYIFLVEMIVKLLAKGFKKYFREYMNYFDAAVVVLSIIELVFVSGEKSTLTAFRTVRIFRIFRVIRVARLFRYLKSMTLIMKVINESLSKFIYLALLLLLFSVIYTLLGLQVFKGQFDFKEGVPRSNYDNFHNSFISTFQVLSIENWQAILFSAMRSKAGIPGAILLISWIILGNFILLNLFLAILLEGFNSRHDDNEITTDEKREGRGSLKKTIFNNFDGRIRKKQEAKKKMMKDMYYESEDSEMDSKFLKSSTMKKSFFENISCEKSLFVFSKSSKIRIFCHQLINNKYFDYFVLFIIFVSTVKVAADTYLLDEPSESEIIKSMIYLDIFFTALFVIEFLIKSIAIGFYEGRSGYIKDIWNFFDFMIIIFSIIDLSFSNINLSVIKSVRILRTLRPLRFISHNVSMKIVVVALFDSLIAIFNVIVVLLIVWLMFAILGVSLLAGKLYSCQNPNYTVKADCINSGYDWESIYPNYDNILNAISTLFILSSEEGWPDIMYQAIDSRDVNLAPKRDSSPYIAYYFVIFILIGSFFFLNFFIGVVFDRFNWAKKNEMSTASLILTKEQILWVEIQKLLVRTKPHAEVEIEKSRIRQICLKIYKNKGFELFIMFIIAVNIVQMSMVYNEASVQYLNVLENINFAITIVFVVEALIKLVAAGPSAYFYNNWNKFDFFVVTTSLLDILLAWLVGSSTILLRLGPQMFKLIRILRISKIIRIFKALKTLETLINIIGYSLPAILNVLSLMTLVFFIYSVLGVNLYHSVKTGKIISAYTNFNNFGNAMVTLLRVSTGEDWYLIMYDCRVSINLTVSAIFFMSFVVITTFVMLNFFIMVILQTYEDFEKNPFHIFKKFTHDIKNIKKIWGKYSDKNNIYRIHFKDLMNLMKELTSDFGDFGQLNYDKMMKKMSAIQIEIDSFGFIYYNDFLFSILRLKYRKRIIGKEAAVNKKIVQREEQETLKKLARLRKVLQQRFYTEKELKDLKSNKKMNFFLEILNVKTIFKTWKKWSKNRKNRIQGRSLSVTPVDSIIEYPGEISLCSIQESSNSSSINFE